MTMTGKTASLMLRARSRVPQGCRVCAASLMLVAHLATPEAQRSPMPPSPRPAVDGVVDALTTQPVVCVGEGTHRGLQDLELRLAILRDARIQALVNDVLVEFGNARYQSVVDRYVSGDEVPESELRRVWEDSVPADTVPDSPVYQRLYRAVREINAGLPTGRRMRILLGDPPIDWDRVQSASDLSAWDERRDAHAAEVVRREVLGRHRRALVFYGAWHCAARNDHTNFTTGDSLRALLDQSNPGAVFALRVFGREDADPRNLEPTIASWPAMTFAQLATTTLGAVDWSAVNALDSRVESQGGTRRLLARDEWRKRSLAEQYDAVIYLAPPSALTVVRITAEQCRDSQYLRMRTQRMAISLGIRPEGAPGDPIGQLRQYCETQTGGK